MDQVPPYEKLPIARPTADELPTVEPPPPEHEGAAPTPQTQVPSETEADGTSRFRASPSPEPAPAPPVDPQDAVPALPGGLEKGQRSRSLEELFPDSPPAQPAPTPLDQGSTKGPRKPAAKSGPGSKPYTDEKQENPRARIARGKAPAAGANPSQASEVKDRPTSASAKSGGAERNRPNNTSSTDRADSPSLTRPRAKAPPPAEVESVIQTRYCPKIFARQSPGEARDAGRNDAERHRLNPLRVGPVIMLSSNPLRDASPGTRTDENAELIEPEKLPPDASASSLEQQRTNPLRAVGEDLETELPATEKNQAKQGLPHEKATSETPKTSRSIMRGPSRPDRRDSAVLPKKSSGLAAESAIVETLEDLAKKRLGTVVPLGMPGLSASNPLRADTRVHGPTHHVRPAAYEETVIDTAPNPLAQQKNPLRTDAAGN